MSAEHAYRIDLAGSITKWSETQIGGLRLDVQFTSFVVASYDVADGPPRREAKLAEEWCTPEALATFPSAPVCVGHPRRVDPSSWRDVTVGSVEGAPVRQGNSLVGRIAVQDGEAVRRIKAGDLRDVSLGYGVDLDTTPGVLDGEAYDAAQRRPRVNHVALLRRGEARIPGARLLNLDSRGSVGVEVRADDEHTTTDGTESAASKARRAMTTREGQQDGEPIDVFAAKKASDARERGDANEKRRQQFPKTMGRGPGPTGATEPVEPDEEEEEDAEPDAAKARSRMAAREKNRFKPPAAKRA